MPDLNGMEGNPMTDNGEKTTEIAVPLGKDAATKLDKRIRTMAGAARGQLETIGNLLDEAKAGKVHEILGFRSWPEYVADAVGGQLELSASARGPLVALMAGEGMSERAIATAIGVSQPTVHRDIAATIPSQVIHDESPEKIRATHSEGPSPRDGQHTGPRTNPPSAANHAEPKAPPPVVGIDGKTYQKREPKPTATERKKQRRPLADDFMHEILKWHPRIKRIAELGADDRIARNAEALIGYRNDLIRFRGVINEVIEQLDGGPPAAVVVQ